MTVITESRLPLPLLRRGKVREVYEVDAGHLLLVASDRVSAFDIVMREPIPRKGAVARMAEVMGRELTARLRDASFAVYRAGRDHAASRDIIIADTKFEFGTAADGALLLIDEVMTPDSSRFWPAERYAPGRGQP